MSNTLDYPGLWVHDDELYMRSFNFPIVGKDGEPNKFTFVEHFVDIVQKAQIKFGPRNLDYCFGGIEFRPQVASPVSCIIRNSNGIDTHFYLIQLGKGCENNWSEAVFEMAHEAVHFLTPVETRHVTNLEEGLATWFQLWYMRTTYLGSQWQRPGGYYATALNEAENLFHDAKAGEQVIKEIRDENGQINISSITPQMLEDKGCDSRRAAFLMEVFPQYL